jgi:hypothetical protein
MLLVLRINCFRLFFPGSGWGTRVSVKVIIFYHQRKTAIRIKDCQHTAKEEGAEPGPGIRNGRFRIQFMPAAGIPEDKSQAPRLLPLHPFHAVHDASSDQAAIPVVW